MTNSEEIPMFEKMPVNEVIALAKIPEHPLNRLAYGYIIEKYKGIIHGTIKKKNYFLQGGDYDDLFQEGMFGIYKAIKDFKEEVGEFETFLKICVDRQLISAIKTSTRNKHKPLNENIPLDRSLPENDNLSMMDLLGARNEVQFNVNFESMSPEEQLLLKDKKTRLRAALAELVSTKEESVFQLYLEGKSYKEIQDILSEENPKMIDNAIQRVKRKIDKIKNAELLEESSESQAENSLNNLQDADAELIDNAIKRVKQKIDNIKNASTDERKGSVK